MTLQPIMGLVAYPFADQVEGGGGFTDKLGHSEGPLIIAATEELPWCRSRVFRTIAVIPHRAVASR